MLNICPLCQQVHLYPLQDKICKVRLQIINLRLEERDLIKQLKEIEMEQPKFEHTPIQRLTVGSDEIRQTAWYQWKYEQLSKKYSRGIADACAVAAYQSSAYADDDYTNDAEGRYL